MLRRMDMIGLVSQRNATEQTAKMRAATRTINTMLPSVRFICPQGYNLIFNVSNSDENFYKGKSKAKAPGPRNKNESDIKMKAK